MNNTIVIKTELIVISMILMLLNCSDGNKTMKMQDPIDIKATSWDTATIKDLINLLGKPIDSLPEIKKYEKKGKEVVYEYDPEYNWFAVKYLYQNKLQMKVESNWVNKNIVNRVTLYSNEIIEGEVYVGQTLGNIRNLIGNKISSPDGYLFVTLDKYLEIAIELDISDIPNTSPLYYGAGSISEFPESLKISSIVIMKR